MELVLSLNRPLPGFDLLEDLGRLIGRVFRLQQGASGGTTKSGKKVMLPRKAVQALGGGNWAKGRGMLNKGTATTAQVNSAKKSVAKPAIKTTGGMTGRKLSATVKGTKPSRLDRPINAMERAKGAKRMASTLKANSRSSSKPAKTSKSDRGSDQSGEKMAMDRFRSRERRIANPRGQAAKEIRDSIRSGNTRGIGSFNNQRIKTRG